MLADPESPALLTPAFNIPASWAFAKRNFAALVGHHFVLAVLGFPLLTLGLFALVVGVYVVAVALQFASLHLRWQIYERDVARGAEAVFVRTRPGADL